jgi:predicted nucleic acid-binding protein
MAYLLDADWVIQALAGHRPTLGTISRLADDGVAVSWITVGEVYEGAFKSRDPQAHLGAFRTFLLAFPILDLDDPTMERFAEVRGHLRRRGELIPDFDILLGAVALRQDLTVLTYNVRHLRRIPGLKVYQAN